MKKSTKTVFIILLIVVFSFASYQIGKGKGEDAVAAETAGQNESFQKLDELRQLIDENYLFDVDEKKVEEGVYKGLFEGLGDPYSVYMNKEEFDRLMESTTGEYAGVGIVVTAGEDNRITVVSPIDGTPAAEAGIKTDDKIIAVNGEQFLGSQLDDAVDIMRGKPGTDVVLTIQRVTEDSNDIFDVNLTRKNIVMETVRTDIIDDIGYMSISEFDENTYDEFLEKKKALENQKVRGIVIDLRGNPGGLLDSVANIADELLPEGLIVKTVARDGTEYKETSDASYDDIPITVLINKGSASASEILAGAIKDYDRGKIIGETSFGKGIVQKIFTLPDGAGVKLTVSEYFTPDGVKIHEKGVKPDIVLELPEDTEGIGPEFLEQDIQLQKALELLK